MAAVSAEDALGSLPTSSPVVFKETGRYAISSSSSSSPRSASSDAVPLLPTSRREVDENMDEGDENMEIVAESIQKLPYYVYIVMWMVLSSAQIGFNKAIFYHWDFPYPLFLISCHMFVSTVVTQLMAKYTTNGIPAMTNVKINFANMYPYLVPLALCQSASMILSNMSYAYLTVSYLQMIKTLTIIFVLALSYLFKLGSPSLFGLLIVLLVVGGVAFASTGELPHSILGVQLQLIGVLAESFRLVITDWLMRNTPLDPFSLIYYTSPICLAIVVTSASIFEFSRLPFDRMLSYPFVFMIEINSILAFALTTSIILLIANTSALGLTICGVAKDTLYLGVSSFLVKTNHHVTTIHHIGYGIAIVGMVIYRLGGDDASMFEFNIGQHLNQFGNAIELPMTSPQSESKLSTLADNPNRAQRWLDDSDSGRKLARDGANAIIHSDIMKS